MPRNGSGVYGPPAGTTATPNTPIESAKYNAYIADAAEALTNSINVNGSAPWQANQPMGGFKFTNQGPGSNSSDSINLGQAQSNVVSHATTVGGSADTITATFSPTFGAWTANMRFRFTAAAANTVIAPTINVDGLGAKTIKKVNGVALGLGDIQGAGHICECIYNGVDVVLLNPALALGTAENIYTAKQIFVGPVANGTTALTDAATIAWDLATGGPNYKVTITSNRVLGAFTGGTNGQEGFLTVAQDGTGGWSLDLSDPVYDFFGPSIEHIAHGAFDETVYNYRITSSGSMILKRLGASSIGGSGRDLLDVKTANGSAAIDLVLTKWLQLYDRFEIDLEDIQAATNNVTFWMRTSTNGGLSYEAGTSDYAWNQHRVSIGGHDAIADNSDGQIVLVDNGTGHGLSNVTGETLAGTVTLYNPRSATPTKVMWQTCHFTDSTSTLLDLLNGLGARLSTSDVDAVRFLMSSGNIVSGSFRLYGIRK